MTPSEFYVTDVMISSEWSPAALGSQLFGATSPPPCCRVTAWSAAVFWFFSDEAQDGKAHIENPNQTGVIHCSRSSLVAFYGVFLSPATLELPIRGWAANMQYIEDRLALPSWGHCFHDVPRQRLSSRVIHKKTHQKRVEFTERDAIWR